MKKILLSAVALFATMTVNAQEVGQILTDDLVNRIGLTTDKNDEGKSIKNDVAAGTVFCESENVTMSAAFDDSYSPENAASPKIDDQNYGTIKIGDFTIDAKQAVQGNSNPKDVDGGNPATASTVPAGGAVFQFDVKKDGYLYVFHKATSNKNYMAYENKAAMGYVYTMSTDGTKALPKVFGYELKGEGEYNYLPEGTAVKTPEKYQLGDDAEEQKLNGLSVIKIPVFAECSYWVNATGSKMTSCGYYFDTTGDATITIDNGVSGELVLLDKGQIPGAEPLPVYSVIGTLVGNWDVDTDLTFIPEENCYTALFENVAAGSYEFKIRQDHDWAINWGSDFKQDGPNYTLEVASDGSKVAISFTPATGEATAVVIGDEPTPASDVVWENDGSKGAISWSSDYRFASEEKKTGEEIAAIPMDVWEKMKTTPFFVDLEGENPQIRVTTGWWDGDATYTGNDITPGNELLTDNGEGKWTLKVDLTATQALLDLVDDHHLLFTGDRYTPVKIYFAESTAIKAVKAAQDSDAIYNVAGQKVNASYKGLVIKNGKKYIQK